MLSCDTFSASLLSAWFQLTIECVCISFALNVTKRVDTVVNGTLS